MTNRRKQLILWTVTFAAVLAIVWSSAPTKIQVLARIGNALPSVARLSVTNGTTEDSPFYFYLQVRRKGGWTEAPNQPEGAGVRRFFVKVYKPFLLKPRSLAMLDLALWPQSVQSLAQFAPPPRWPRLEQ